VLCPKCKTDHAHRSHRRGWFENSASLFRYYPYRCSQCNYRFLKKREEVGEPLGAEQPGEREIRATRASNNRSRRQRNFAIFSAAVLIFLGFLYLITRERGPANDGRVTPPARLSPRETGQQQV